MEKLKAMIKKLSELLDSVYALWDKLPKEIKVSAYIALSQGMADLIVELNLIKTNSILLGLGINVILVFLKQLKQRVLALTALIRSLKKK